jgi:uncharacterized protein (DUF362 family)
MSFVDRAIGVRHFLFDRVQGNVPDVPPKRHKQNPWLKDGKPIVSKVRAGTDTRKSIDQVLQLLGPLNLAVSRGDKVLVKPNFNSDDPPPASTDLMFLKEVIEILLELGAKVTVGESSGGIWRPTRNVFNKLHLPELTKSLGVELIAFEEKPNNWVRIKIDGEYLHSVVMPRSAYEAEKLVYLPCLKTHGLARYSGALKLAFGFVHPGERRAFHLKYREEKLAEISLCWQPDLIILDGRKAFVTGGPQNGKIEVPNVILASGDLVAIDVEAVKILLSYKTQNKLLSDPWSLPQITTAVKHGLGAGKDGYVLSDVSVLK